MPNHAAHRKTSSRSAGGSLSAHLSGVRIGGEREVPTEFRIFASGANPSEKGTFRFTEKSALSVMAEYTSHATPMAVPLRRTPCLTDDEVRALARLGRQVEDHYGAPQDIEWALVGDSPGRFVLLQSRPETVWAARDRGPIASPQAKASDHVLARFSRGL